MNKKPLVLMILDGFGNAGEKDNAIFSAKTPNIEAIFSSNPIDQTVHSYVFTSNHDAGQGRLC